jgi:hypothetical protein
MTAQKYSCHDHTFGAEDENSVSPKQWYLNIALQF